MTDDELRECENYALSKKLSEISNVDNLQFLARLITDHDHLRSKLMTESNRNARAAKLEAMKPYLRFKALPLDKYELAEAARAVGCQPIYEEQAQLEKSRIWMPPSVPFMVK